MIFGFTLPFQVLAMRPTETQMDCGFTQGCFHYDALVQAIGAGIAVAGALVIYQRTQRSERLNAQEDRDHAAEQQRVLLSEQKSQFDAQLQVQREQWDQERRNAQLERSYRVLSQRTAAALSAQIEVIKLERAFQLAEFGKTAPKANASVLDSLARDYVLLPPDLVNIIADAHLNIETALMMQDSGWVPMVHGKALSDLTAARELLTSRGAELQKETFAAYEAFSRAAESEGC